ncbi:hypothetical protein GPECTOR_15g432 [Gonium pectorale]|uniref:Uncharacterized protein n=1 Tax=Gonium pectorale TaxID=33097 RepID=A0A150GLS4_GONPE|nr:hypothetical protein GPECTOR_15g432 [Gonium pectorale]|eukprot:KXZ50747.1 hypothetical protein GPECTOR_15g432 [Gonium pectorale]
MVRFESDSDSEAFVLTVPGPKRKAPPPVRQASSGGRPRACKAAAAKAAAPAARGPHCGADLEDAAGADTVTDEGSNRTTDDDDGDFVPASSAGTRGKGQLQCSRAAKTSTITGGMDAASQIGDAQADQATGAQWQPLQLTDEKSISKYLRKAARMTEEYLAAAAAGAGGVSDGDVRVVKALSRAPRSNTVRERHPGVVLKSVLFAEQVMIEPLELLLNVRDRSRRSRCPIIALSDSAGDGGDRDGDGMAAAAPQHREVFLAEPCVVYRLPSGEWYLEYYRFYSESDLAAVATAIGRPVNVPADFVGRRELMRDTDRSHCRQGVTLTCIRGDLGVMRTKKVPPLGPAGRAGTGRPAFCRYIFDSHTGDALTDQPVSDFVVEA